MQAAQRYRERKRHGENSGQAGTCSGDTDVQVRNLNENLNSLITLVQSDNSRLKCLLEAEHS